MYVAALPTKMSYESSSQPLSRRVTPTIRQNLRKSALSTFSCREARLEAEFRLGNISPVFPYPTGDVERLSLDREGHATVTSIDVDLQHERPSSLLLCDNVHARPPQTGDGCDGSLRGVPHRFVDGFRAFVRLTTTRQTTDIPDENRFTLCGDRCPAKSLPG